MSGAGAQETSFSSSRFRVELDGIGHSDVLSVSGLQSAIAVIEVRETADQNVTVIHVPGRASYASIVLKWAMTDNRELYDWHHEALIGNVQHKDGAVILFDGGGSEIARWIFVKAWPSKYSAPDFNAGGNEIAIETLEITHEGLTRV